MITVNVRKQGGAAVITIPSDVLKILNIDIGATLEIDVSKDSFTAHPLKLKQRKRYSLKELLHGAKLEDIKNLNKKTKWAREGKPIGREII